MVKSVIGISRLINGKHSLLKKGHIDELSGSLKQDNSFLLFGIYLRVAE